MALHTFGSNSASSLNAVKFNPAQGVGAGAAASLLSAADLAAIANSIVGDSHFGAALYQGIAGAKGILCTGSTHSNTTLDTLVSTGGGPLAAIQVGALVLGVGIPPGTFVIAKPSATSVTLSQAATTTAAGVAIGIMYPQPSRGGFNFQGQLEIPGRGLVTVRPGDVVAIDNTGWPILVSAASVNYSGTLWTFS